jgi:hypothetical protein
MKKNKELYSKYSTHLYLFFISVFISLVLWDAIRLPFHNPWGVSGNLVKIAYNPANNLVRFALLIALPVLGLGLLSFLFRNKADAAYFKRCTANVSPEDCIRLSSLWRISFFVMFLVYTLLFVLNISTYHSNGPLDTFHEGESLGTAISYMKGFAPYTDFLFVHGTVQDPLRAVLAFQLFGKSIGAVRTLESIVTLLTFTLFFFFIFRLFKGNPLSIFISLAVMYGLQMKGPFDISKVLVIPILIAPRDIVTFAFLAIFVGLGRYLERGEEAADKKLFSVMVFLLALIPIAAFGYSIDRGFYLTTAYTLLWVLLFVFHFRNSVLQKSYIISTLLGAVCGMILLGFILKGAFWDFFKFAFLIMPQYKELMDGFVYPIYDVRYLFPCLLIAMNLYWMVYKFIQELRECKAGWFEGIRGYLAKYLVELLLLLLSVFFYRSALGRSDGEHVAYSTAPAYILSLLIILKHYLPAVTEKYGRSRKVLCSILLVLILLCGTKVYHISHNHLLSQKFPVKTSDFNYIPGEYLRTYEFFRYRLKPDEYFITLTSEAIWYYFADKPCPIRFPVVWFAMPRFYQEEIVEDLKTKNIKYILYRNSHWANAIDGFPNEEKLPILMQYIHQNYEPYLNRDNSEIWVRK